MIKLCSVEGCGTQSKQQGLCGKHAQRLYRTGTTDPKQKSVNCSVDGCETKPRARGLCQTHATRFYRHGDPSMKKKVGPAYRQPVFLGDLAYIPLSDAEDPEYTVIDRIDWPLVKDYNWSNSGEGYARGWMSRNGKNILLHKLLTGEGGWDHINRDGLDNRRSNLRPATQSQQCANQGVRSTNTNGFKGVSFNKRNQKFIARIRIDGKNKSLGYHLTAEEAAQAYNVAAFKMWGDRAFLNPLP